MAIRIDGSSEEKVRYYYSHDIVARPQNIVVSDI